MNRAGLSMNDTTTGLVRKTVGSAAEAGLDTLTLGTGLKGASVLAKAPKTVQKIGAVAKPATIGGASGVAYTSQQDGASLKDYALSGVTSAVIGGALPLVTTGLVKGAKNAYTKTSNVAKTANTKLEQLNPGILELDTQYKNLNKQWQTASATGRRQIESAIKANRAERSRISQAHAETPKRGLFNLNQSGSTTPESPILGGVGKLVKSDGNLYSITNSNIAFGSDVTGGIISYKPNGVGSIPETISYEKLSDKTRNRLVNAENNYEKAKLNSRGPVKAGTIGEVQKTRQELKIAQSKAIEELGLQDHATVEDATGKIIKQPKIDRYNSWLENIYKNGGGNPDERRLLVKDMAENPNKYMSQFDAYEKGAVGKDVRPEAQKPVAAPIEKTAQTAVAPTKPQTTTRPTAQDFEPTTATKTQAAPPVPPKPPVMDGEPLALPGGQTKKSTYANKTVPKSEYVSEGVKQKLDSPEYSVNTEKQAYQESGRKYNAMGEDAFIADAEKRLQRPYGEPNRQDIVDAQSAAAILDAKHDDASLARASAIYEEISKHLTALSLRMELFSFLL
jgi:hypothetical protein